MLDNILNHYLNGIVMRSSQKPILVVEGEGDRRILQNHFLNVYMPGQSVVEMRGKICNSGDSIKDLSGVKVLIHIATKLKDKNINNSIVFLADRDYRPDFDNVPNIHNLVFTEYHDFPMDLYTSLGDKKISEMIYIALQSKKYTENDIHNILSKTWDEAKEFSYKRYAVAHVHESLSQKHRNLGKIPNDPEKYKDFPNNILRYYENRLGLSESESHEVCNILNSIISDDSASSLKLVRDHNFISIFCKNIGHKLTSREFQNIFAFGIRCYDLMSIKSIEKILDIFSNQDILPCNKCNP